MSHTNSNKSKYKVLLFIGTLLLASIPTQINGAVDDSWDAATPVGGSSLPLETGQKKTFSYKVKHSVDHMIGTNSFIDVPMENMEAVGFIREYHP